MSVGLISSGIWFLIFLLLQIAALNLRPEVMRSRITLRLFTAAVLGHAFTIAILHMWMPEILEFQDSRFLLSLVCGWILQACLFVLYMPFYYTIHTSLSVETIAMLEKNKAAIAIDDFDRRFCSVEFVRDRLKTMELNGYLVKTGDDCWIVTTRGAKVARWMRKIKILLNLGPGG